MDLHVTFSIICNFISIEYLFLRFNYKKFPIFAKLNNKRNDFSRCLSKSAGKFTNFKRYTTGTLLMPSRVQRKAKKSATEPLSRIGVEVDFLVPAAWRKARDRKGREDETCARWKTAFERDEDGARSI